MYPLKRLAENMQKHIKASFKDKTALPKPNNGTINVSAKNHLRGPAPGKVVFFVLNKNVNGYKIRLVGKEYQLTTDQKLIVARTYIGRLLENRGGILTMAKNFINVDQNTGLTAFVEQYSAGVIAMLLRNNYPLKESSLRKLTAFLKLHDLKTDEEDILVDALSKNVLSDQILRHIGLSYGYDPSGGKGQEQKDASDGETNEKELKETVKAGLLRTEGSETPLLLYNHIKNGTNTHWVHIPLRLLGDDCEIEGYVRILFDLESKKYKKAILHTLSTGKDELLCEISEGKGGYRIKGNVPEVLKDKLLGSNRRIVDIKKRYKDTYTGLSFDRLQNISGVDLDA